MKKKIHLIYLLSAILLNSCDHSVQEQASTGDPIADNTVQLSAAQLANSGIEIGKPEKVVLSTALRVNGVIDVPPQNMVSISVPLGGYLRNTNLLPGMHVNKGDVIAEMEDPQYIQIQQDYLTAKAHLQFSEKEFERQKELNQSKSASDKTLQMAESDFSSQKVLVRSLSEKLKLIGVDPEKLDENSLSRKIKMLSPINGYVSKVNVNIGRYAKPEDVLFEIVNPEDVHLVLYVFEKDINKLSIGQQVIAYSNTAPEHKFECEIILIGKDFGRDRNVEVHCHFDNYDHSLIPGMFMNAEVQINQMEVMALPSDAVLSMDDKNYVFQVLSDSLFELVEVKAGVIENGYTEVISLNGTDMHDMSVVTKGSYWLLMQMKKGEEGD